MSVVNIEKIEFLGYILIEKIKVDSFVFLSLNVRYWFKFVEIFDIRENFVF